jgi:beta-glucosidase
VVLPYQDPSNSVNNRVEDLLARLTVQEGRTDVSRHDHDGPGGQLISSDNPFGRPATEVAIRDMRLNHFNLAAADGIVD